MQWVSSRIWTCVAVFISYYDNNYTIVFAHNIYVCVYVCVCVCVCVHIWFGLVSLFNGISTFVGYLMPNLFFEKNSSGTI